MADNTLTEHARIERAAAAWLARRDAGGWTALDQAALDAWLAAATAHRVAWVRLETAWREAGRLKALGAGLPAGTVPARGRWGQAGSRTAEQREPSAPDQAGMDAVPAPQALNPANLVFAPRPRVAKSRAPALVAAAVLVLLGTSFVLGWRDFPSARPIAYRTAVGSLETTPLADGSEATLSSDSHIVVALSRRERHIDLQRGEAFFHAARDPERPFVVAAQGYRAVAVGTRFAVRRVAGEVRIVVTEGLVRLESDAGADRRHRPTTLLPAGSTALAGDDGVVVRPGTVEQAERLLSWRDGFLTFQDTPLAAAAAEFNRYNARRIVIGDPTIAAVRIGGNFRWSNADAFVRLLEQGFGVRAERHPDRIVLRAQ
ncbi:MAG TPA: FecR domain-containing protein [Xanthomonadaceae bacterium]|nr:FecR domain-containing protein [Xanthomonadaceae bacterium]